MICKFSCTRNRAHLLAMLTLLHLKESLVVAVVVVAVAVVVEQM
jgi:hypothetical protein